MLLNIAEDLKDAAKIKVAPGGKNAEKQDAKGEGKKKSSDYDKFKEMAEAQAFVKLNDHDIEDDSAAYDEDGDRASYLYMELQSTTTFKDVDIDKMLEHTTLDDFMRGLYSKQRAGEGYSVFDEKNKNVMGSLMTG